MPKKKTAVPPTMFKDFVADHPTIAGAYEALGKAVRAAGPLTEREVALVKLAISVGARLEGGVHAHVRKALAAGIDRKAIEQVALLAIPTIGWPPAMAAYTWVEDKGRVRRGANRA